MGNSRTPVDGSRLALRTYSVLLVRVLCEGPTLTVGVFGEGSVMQINRSPSHSLLDWVI